MTAAERYQVLESHLLRTRALGTATEAQLDALLEEMDAAWDALSETERAVADARAAALARIAAPDDLRLHDDVRAIGDPHLPRKAA